MSLRMTGLASGMDVEGMVKELVSAKSLKKKKIESNKTKHEWKQEKWAALNTKLLNLYKGSVSKLRMQSTYNAKKATSSDETKLTAKANNNVANGTYKIQVKQVAASQYFTSGKLDTSKLSGDVSTSTKLSDLDSSLVGQEVTFGTKNGSTSFQIRSDSTIDDFLSAAKEAGLNASFDATQKRFFISAKDSGAENVFTIKTSALSQEEITSRQGIESFTNYSSLNSANKALVDGVYNKLNTAFEKYKKENAGMSDADVKAAFKDTDEYKSAVSTLSDVAMTQKKSEITSAATNALKATLYQENYADVASDVTSKRTYYDFDKETGDWNIKKSYTEKYGAEYDAFTSEDIEKLGQTKDEYIQASVQKLIDKDIDTALKSKVNSLVSDDFATKTRLQAFEAGGLSDLSGFSDDLVEKYSLKTYDAMSTVVPADYETQAGVLLDSYMNVETHGTANAGALNSLGLADISIDADGKAVASGGNGGYSLISAQDSIINVNGADMTSSTTSISVNGISIEAKAETAPGETISLTVSNDTSGVYDAIKEALKEYNSIMKEMSDSYSAASAREYDVLTDDEKEAMTDKEIELWETKIKDSLLRNDSTLNGLMSSFRSSLQGTVQVNGKNFSLSTFGIMTSSDFMDAGQLHIYGDKDDAVYMDVEDKLQAALSNNPEETAEALSKLFKKLYDTMADKMKASKVSSTMSFYNDKQMKTELNTYKDQIKLWTERLTDMEDKYYKQFSAMEKAMSNLTSQQGYLNGLMG